MQQTLDIVIPQTMSTLSIKVDCCPLSVSDGGVQHVAARLATWVSHIVSCVVSLHVAHGTYQAELGEAWGGGCTPALALVSFSSLAFRSCRHWRCVPCNAHGLTHRVALRVVLYGVGVLANVC